MVHISISNSDGINSKDIITRLVSNLVNKILTWFCTQVMVFYQANIILVWVSVVTRNIHKKLMVITRIIHRIETHV